jgi:hypothetical protein
VCQRDYGRRCRNTCQHAVNYLAASALRPSVALPSPMVGVAAVRAVPVVASLIALAAFAVACGGGGGDSNNLVHSEHVSKATFHGTWPVTSDAGTLACDATKGGSITFSPDGSADTYAENGTAMGWAPKEGWKDFHEIWLVDPTGPGPNVNASDFDAEGQKLCSENK